MRPRAPGGEDRDASLQSPTASSPPGQNSLAVGAPPPAALAADPTMIGGLTAAGVQQLLSQSPQRTEPKVGVLPSASGWPPPAAAGKATVVASIRPPQVVSAPAAGPGSPNHVALAPVVYPAASVALPPPAARAPGAESRSSGVLLGVFGTLGLVAVAAAVFVFVAQPMLPLARTPPEVRTVATAAPPTLNQSRVAGASSAADALISACLRDSSQVVNSTTRDQLLLDALKAYDAGNRERAHTLLKEYTHEACDRATLELLLALERQVTHRTQER